MSQPNTITKYDWDKTYPKTFGVGAWRNRYSENVTITTVKIKKNMAGKLKVMYNGNILHQIEYTGQSAHFKSAVRSTAEETHLLVDV